MTRQRLIPHHLKLNQPRLFLLRRWARIIEAEYERGVYLVGSALRNDNANPRDWDIRVPLTYAQFAARYASRRQRDVMSGRDIALLWNDQYYGRTDDDRQIYWNWYHESTKVMKTAFRVHLGLNVDFHSCPPCEWRAWNGPYWRIS